MLTLKIFVVCCFYRGVAQSGSAFLLERKGRRFDFSHPDQFIYAIYILRKQTPQTIPTQEKATTTKKDTVPKQLLVWPHLSLVVG